MSEYDEYRKRLNQNGKDLGEAYNNNTIAFIESAFHASPTFRELEVKSFEKPHITKMDARVVEVERLGTLKEVLFRPTSEGLGEGTYIKFDEHTWIIFDSWGKQKVTVAQCNRKLKWIDKNGHLQSIDCVASATDLGSKAKQSKNELEWNSYDVSMPIGQLFVFVELRPETAEIKLGQRFIFGSKVYEVVGYDDTTTVREIDDKLYGVLQLTIKITIKKEEDDFVNKIAYNSYNTPSTPVTPEPPVDEDDDDEENGGVIW